MITVLSLCCSTLVLGAVLAVCPGCNDVKEGEYAQHIGPDIGLAMVWKLARNGVSVHICMEGGETEKAAAVTQEPGNGPDLCPHNEFVYKTCAQRPLGNLLARGQRVLGKVHGCGLPLLVSLLEIWV